MPLHQQTYCPRCKRTVDKGQCYHYPFAFPHCTGCGVPWKPGMEAEACPGYALPPAQAIACLHAIAQHQEDKEMEHIAGDEILCRVLTMLGHADVVAAWDALDKWYA